MFPERCYNTFNEGVDFFLFRALRENNNIWNATEVLLLTV